MSTGPISIHAHVPSSISPSKFLPGFLAYHKVTYQLVATAETKPGFLFQQTMGTAIKPRSEEEKQKLLQDRRYVPTLTRSIRFGEGLTGITHRDMVFVKIEDIALSGIFTPRTLKELNDIPDPSLRAVRFYHKMQDHLLKQVIDAHKKITLIQKWSQPIDEETRKEADTLVHHLRQVPCTEEHMRILEPGRIGGSQTIRSRPERLQHWRTADAYMQKLVRDREPMTLEHLSELNRLIAGDEQTEEDLSIGKLRDFPVMTGGMLGPGYIGESDVPTMTNELLQFLNTGLERVQRGEENPIVLAAQVFQRAVSIHPFGDANGRTTRLLMDYVLLRSNLPPAPLGENVNVAIFGDQQTTELPPPVTPSMAVSMVTQALRSAYEQMQHKG